MPRHGLTALAMQYLYAVDECEQHPLHNLLQLKTGGQMISYVVFCRWEEVFDALMQVLAAARSGGVYVMSRPGVVGMC